jgi:hypothetical protein
MIRLILFVSTLILFSCTNSKDATNENNNINYKDIIKSINERFQVSVNNKTIVQKDVNHSYTYILKDGENLECLYELGYDSEGWPMVGDVYYFHEKKLIGYAYVTCDGCSDEDVANKLKSLPIKNYKSETNSETNLEDWDVIWLIDEPTPKLKQKTAEILESLESNSDNDAPPSYGEIRGRIIGGNLRMLKNELGSPSYTEIATKFIKNAYNNSLPIGLFDLCLNYEVYVYENYLGDGANLLVIVSDSKVTNVIPQNEVQDVKDICCCD